MCSASRCEAPGCASTTAHPPKPAPVIFAPHANPDRTLVSTTQSSSGQLTRYSSRSEACDSLSNAPRRATSPASIAAAAALTLACSVVTWRTKGARSSPLSCAGSIRDSPKGMGDASARCFTPSSPAAARHPATRAAYAVEASVLGTSVSTTSTSAEGGRGTCLNDTGSRQRKSRACPGIATHETAWSINPQGTPANSCSTR